MLSSWLLQTGCFFSGADTSFRHPGKTCRLVCPKSSSTPLGNTIDRFKVNVPTRITGGVKEREKLLSHIYHQHWSQKSLLRFGTTLVPILMIKQSPSCSGLPLTLLENHNTQSTLWNGPHQTRFDAAGD